MRTTLDIVDDVLLRSRIGLTARNVALASLIHRYWTPVPSESESFFGFELLPSRGKAVSNELIDKLRDEDHG